MPTLIFNPLQGEFNFSRGKGGGSAGISGFLQQVVTTFSNALSTAVEIADDFETAPAATDGASLTTMAITPVGGASSKLMIEGVVTFDLTGAQGVALAVFDGISADPVGIVYKNASTLTGIQIEQTAFSFEYTPDGSGDEITFDFRYGLIASISTELATINASAAAGVSTPVGDGFNFSTLKITEIASGASVPFQITIVGDDNEPQTGTSFRFSGANGFLMLWNNGAARFDVTPPNSVVSGGNGIFGTSGAIQLAKTTICFNAAPTSVSLPANVGTNVGDAFELIGVLAGVTITQAANQVCQIGPQLSTVGASGTLVATAVGASIQMRMVSTAGGIYTWAAMGAPQGPWTAN